MKGFAVLLSFCLLAGCASTPPAAPPAVFADASFAPPSEPVRTDELFKLSPDMRAYLNSPAFNNLIRERGSRYGLVEALYRKSDLQIEYESTTTRTAAQTYADRAGNCLSLVIMTAAFAKALDMPVVFRKIEADSTWSRTGGLYLSSSHINIAIGERRAVGMGSSEQDEMLLVDFIPQDAAKRLRARQLDEDDVLALYLNNRAAELLVQDRVDDAYWWAKAAVTKRPASTVALNTLGVVYHRHGQPALAEQVFRTALEREPENIHVMRNLQPVLAELGKAEAAAVVAQHIARLEPVPPYHYFDMGMRALDAGDYGKARDLLAREVKRSPFNDEFRFWLGVAHLRLGDVKHAREQIARAVDTSTRRETRDMYSAKLSHLLRLSATGRTSADL